MGILLSFSVKKKEAKKKRGSMFCRKTKYRIPARHNKAIYVDEQERSIEKAWAGGKIALKRYL